MSVLQSIKAHPVRWATIASILTGFYIQGMLLLSGILAARILGVEDRGYLALLVAFPTLCSQLLGMGFPQAITYQLVANPNEISKLERMSKKWFVFQMIGIVIVHGIILSVYLDRNSDLQPTTAYLTLIIGPAMLVMNYGLAFFQGIGDFNRLLIVRLFFSSGYTVMLVVLFVLEAVDLYSVTLVWVISLLSAGILSVKLLRKLKSSKKVLASSNKILSQQEMLKFGLKGLVGSTSPMETFRLDQLAAGLILSSSALGLYVVAQAFCSLTHLVAQSASLVAYPTVASKGYGRAGQATMWRFFCAVTFINGLVTAFLIITVPILIPLFFGREFIGAISVAQILLVGAALAASRRILVEGFRGLGKPQVSTIAEVSMYPWLFTAGIILVWHYGVEGLAMAVTSGYGLSLAIAVGFGLKIQREFPLPLGSNSGVGLIRFMSPFRNNK